MVKRVPPIARFFQFRVTAVQPGPTQTNRHTHRHTHRHAYRHAHTLTGWLALPNWSQVENSSFIRCVCVCFSLSLCTWECGACVCVCVHEYTHTLSLENQQGTQNVVRVCVSLVPSQRAQKWLEYPPIVDATRCATKGATRTLQQVNCSSHHSFWSEVSSSERGPRKGAHYVPREGYILQGWSFVGKPELNTRV